MSGRIPDSFIDELLARVDIVELVESRVPLKRAGRNHQARCPFHDERSPSFTVSSEKQFYHCFGCGAHGSAIRFLMEYDRLDFVDAIEELAQRVGLKVPRDAAQSAARSDSADLYSVLELSAKFYQAQLPNNNAAQEYLQNRGVDEATQKRFMIGFAPDSWDALGNAIGKDATRQKLLDKAGMLSSNERGNQYDRFRDRLMFPIHDRRGRVIAFGGRVLGDGTPKYLNSPETPLFHKGRELYGLYQVRQAHSKIPRLLVVEGYMDVVSLFQFGFTQAVATLGTATTKDHAEILFRNSVDVFFCFDGDNAGRTAAWRAVESVLPRMRDGRQAYFLFLPDGEDPDSIVRKEGSAGFEQRLQDATPLSTFFFDHLEIGVDLSSADGRARLAERCKTLIAQIPDGAFLDSMQQMLVQKTALVWSLPNAAPNLRELSEQILDQRVADARGDLPSANNVSRMGRAPTASDADNPRKTIVRTAIALLIQKPELASKLHTPLQFEHLRQPGVPLLMELIELCRQRPDIRTGALLELFANREEYAALSKLAAQEFPSAPQSWENTVDDQQTRWQQELNDAIAKLERTTTQQRLDELLAQQKQAGLSDAEKQELRDLMLVKWSHN